MEPTTIGQILRFNLTTWVMVGTLQDESRPAVGLLARAHPNESLGAILFDRAGRRCYSVGRGDTEIVGATSSLALWVDGKPVNRRDRSRYLQGAALSPSARLLAVGTRSGEVEVWRVR